MKFSPGALRDSADANWAESEGRASVLIFGVLPLKAFLDAHPEAPAEEIEKLIYDLGRASYDKPGKIFPLMYRAILGQERGPRLGAVIRLATPQRVSELIAASLHAAS